MLSQELIDAGLSIADVTLSTPCVQHPVFGEIDLSQLSLIRAEELIGAGYVGLVKSSVADVEPVTNDSAEEEQPVMVVSKQSKKKDVHL